MKKSERTNNVLFFDENSCYMEMNQCFSFRLNVTAAYLKEIGSNEHKHVNYGEVQ